MIIALAALFSPVSFGPLNASLWPLRSHGEIPASALPDLLIPSRVSFSWAW
jgi:hypothetical protein